MRAWVRQSREEGRRRGEERLENLGQTASEPRLKRWRKCTQPVGIQYQGSRPMSRGTSGWWGGRKVCQLHNDTPPDLRAEETCDHLPPGRLVFSVFLRRKPLKLRPTAVTSQLLKS